MEGSIDPGEILETGTLKLIESMEDAVLVIDMDGKILKVNESFQKITGYSEEEVVGENAVEVAKQMIKEEDQELALETLKEKTFKGKTHDPMDIKIESKGGEERYLNLRSSLIEDEEAERTLNVTIAREITDEKKMERTLEKSRKKYKKMLELSPEGIVVHQDGRLQYVNPSGAEILGIENRDEHIGKSIMKAVHPDHREEVKDRMKMMTEEGKKVPLIEEKFVRLDDGEVIDVEVAAAPIELDGKASILVIFRNISDRKEVEKTLKERERKVKDLYESTVKFERCKSKEEVFEVALESAKNILDFYSSSIIMAEDEDLVIKATTDEDIEVGRKFPLDEGIRGLTYQNDESYLIDDLSEWEEAKPTNEKFESVISVPIGDVGVFQALSDEKGYYDEFDLEMSRVLATHIKETTERVKAEEDLKKSEQKFRSLFEASPDAIYWIDEDGYIQDVNKAFKEKLGYERERLIGTHITDAWFLDEESLEKIKEKRRRRKKGEDVGPYTIKIVDDEGNIHYSEINAHQITYNGGDRGKIVVSRDITERKEREKAIQEAKQNYEELFEKSADALYVLDPDTAEVLDINQRMCEMYGYSREEALQLTIEDTSSGEYPYTQEEAKRRVQKAKEEGPITFEWRGQKKDGTLTWEEVTLKQAEIGGQSRILASVRDITERKKAQEELNKRSEAMETSMDGIAILDENEEYVYLNEAHAEIYGYDDPDEILGKTWSVLYDEEELKRFKEEIMPTIREKGRWRGEATGIKKDGTKFPQEMSLTALEDGALICVVRDIRDRKKAEEELEKSREKYRLLTEEVNDLIVLVNLEGEFQFVNEAHKRLLGYDPEELIGNNSLELIHPDDRDRVKEQFMRGIKKGHAEGEARVSTKDGSYKWIESHGRFMPDEEQVLIVNRDITERKKRERKIEHLNSLLRSIREINQLITKKEDLDHVMKEAPKVLRETRDYSKVSIMMVEEGEVDLHIGDPDRINIEDLDSRIEELRRTEEPLTISLEEEGTRTRVLVPLIDKKMEGVLAVDIEGEVKKEELEPLEDIAGDLALAKTKKETEKELKRSLKEKNVLLDEINHRVKNNMQVISSMLTLQAEKQQNEVATKVLQQGEQRIQSMALIHEMLYRSEDMAEIDLANYIDELVKTLYRTYGIESEEVELEMDLEDIKLGIDQANPLAQVLNELVSNSLEHAFPEDYKGKGKLKISTSVEDEERIQVLVSDNGVGIPEEVDLEGSETFGFQLINMLVEDQLDGNVELEKDGGTTFKIRFEKERVNYA